MELVAAIPGAGEVARIGPGLLRVRVELADHAFGHLNSYVYRTAAGLLAIDVPWDAPGTLEAYELLLEAAGMDPAELRVILATHYHDDHCGTAARLRTASGAAFGLHVVDAANLRRRFGDKGAFLRDVIAWLDTVGADERAREMATRQVLEIDSRAHLPEPDFEIDDGERIRLGEVELVALHTPGHTSGHLSFHDPARDAVFSGDHLYRVRRGSASTRPYSSANPMADFWRSNDRLRALRPATVHPGHEDSFADLDIRLTELRANHLRRLEQVLELTAEPASAAQVASGIKRSRPWESLSVTGVLTAIGEAHAYLIDAESRGLVSRIPGTPDRWRRIAAAIARDRAS